MSISDRLTSKHCKILNQHRNYLCWAFAVSVSCLSLAGCGDDSAGHAVSGKVSFQGQPIDQGTINFRATDGSLYGGGLGADGSFEYELPSGDYQVRIDAPAPMPSGWKEGDPMPSGDKRLVPLKYANFGSSGLSASISDDPSSHQIDYQLK